MKLQDIFDYMENTIGWNLDDFYNVYCVHKDYMFDYCDTVNDTVNDDEQLWCCQFMTDFLRALESLIEKENETMEILNLYHDIKRDEVRQKRTKELEKLKNSHPVIKAINEFRNSMKDVKGLMFSYTYAFEKDAEFDAKTEKLNEKYDKKRADLTLEYNEISTMLTDCETYEQKQNILKAYGVVDEHGKLRK